MRSLFLRMTLTVGVLVAGLTAVAPPASAATYPVFANLESGRRDLQTMSAFGTLNRDTPGSGVEACEPSKTVAAEFDDVAGTVSNFVISVQEPFTLPVFGGTYELEASSVSSMAGTWNPVTGAWTGVRAEIELEIFTFTEDGCTRGIPVCRGNLDMEFSGTTAFGAEGPIPGASGPVWVEGLTERRMTVGPDCQNVWTVLLPGADIRIEDNPISPAPGAEYR